MSPGLADFRANLLDAAGCALERAHPDFVSTFSQVLEATQDPDQAHAAVASIATDQGFARWRPLLVSLYDVELQMARVRSALKLHGTRAEASILTMWTMNEGSWVDYHQAAWTLYIDGMLERVRKLLRQSCRGLIRPFSQDWRATEKRLCSVPDDLLGRLASMRDPIAHGGGPVEALAQERLIEGQAVLGIWFDALYLLEKQRDSQSKWQEHMHKFTLLTFAWIEQTLDELNQAVPWKDVRASWC